MRELSRTLAHFVSPLPGQHSGKTTFIKQVLEEFNQIKFLIIENEFGEIGIDGDILSEDENALIELNNGCICCNIQSDLQRILQKVLSQETVFDHILIEATGVANPAKIATQFLPPSPLANFFDLNSIICVIDTENFRKHRLLPEFELQVLTSDSYILSKTNETQEQPIDDISKELKIPANSFRTVSHLEDWFFEASFFELDHTLLKGGEHHHYQKLSFKIEGEFEIRKLQWCLNILFKQYKEKIFRIKGILFLENESEPILLQGVFDSIVFAPFSSKVNRKTNQFVLIGENLNSKNIQESFMNCLA